MKGVKAIATVEVIPDGWTLVSDLSATFRHNANEDVGGRAAIYIRCLPGPRTPASAASAVADADAAEIRPTRLYVTEPRPNRPHFPTWRLTLCACVT